MSRYIYLKCGSNILRIKQKILQNKLKDNSIDFSKYLEVLVADGNDKYHFEINNVSMCIAEDYDIMQLPTTDLRLKKVFKYNIPNKSPDQVFVKKQVNYKYPNIKRSSRMTKELDALEVLGNIEVAYNRNGIEGCYSIKDTNEYDIIEKALIEKENNQFELEVFKLAYEWKCNGVEGTYEEILEEAKKTVTGWHEIAKKGYGEVVNE